jgi:LEA14-like dessication related protein
MHRSALRPVRRLVTVAAIALAVSALAMGSAGCATTTAQEPFEVTLAGLELGEMTLFETSLLARLRVTNPNPEAVAIDGASFKLMLDGKKIGSGTAPAAFTVERLSSALIDAEFHVNNATVLLQIKDILGQQTVSYGVTGSLFTRGTFGTRRIRVENSGSLDLGQGITAQNAGP